MTSARKLITHPNSDKNGKLPSASPAPGRTQCSAQHFFKNTTACRDKTFPRQLLYSLQLIQHRL